MIFKEIKKLHKQGYKCIVGVDEAGRGPLAGPVVAAAVAAANLKLKIEKVKIFEKIKDSKKLSAKQREEWYKILTKYPGLQWAVASVSHKIIDKINILEATKLAMRRTVRKLGKKIGKPIDFLIIDGNFILSLAEVRPPRCWRRSDLRQAALPKADEKIFLCMAAGIISKVTRDRVMRRLHKKYPQYNFAKHKGYGTKEHIRVIKKLGACSIHRKSFEPIKSLISKS